MTTVFNPLLQRINVITLQTDSYGSIQLTLRYTSLHKLWNEQLVKIIRLN